MIIQAEIPVWRAYPLLLATSRQSYRQLRVTTDRG